MMYGRGFVGNNGCIGFEYFNYWNFIIIGVIIISVIVLIVWKNNENNISKNSEVIISLQEKFINGEISEEEYLNKKNVLSKK